MKKTTCEMVLEDLIIVLGHMPKRAAKSRERMVRSITRLKSVVAFSKKCGVSTTTGWATEGGESWQK